jgi:hypothetical protein
MAELLRAAARTVKALRALARESDTPGPVTRTYVRWLSLKLYELSDDLQGEIDKHLSSAAALDPDRAPNGTPKEHNNNE